MTATNLAIGTSLRDHIINIFSSHAHNIPYYRIIYSFLPGKPIREWKFKPNDAAKYGLLHVVKALHKRGCHCDRHGADIAAGNGHIDVVCWLFEHCNIRCTRHGADIAAGNGHIDVVRWLFEHCNIRCTKHGADHAATNGYADVLRYLCDHDIHLPSLWYGPCIDYHTTCTTWAANRAAMGGRLGVIQRLRAHAVDCTSTGADLAAQYGHLDVIEDLRTNGIHCTSYGAELAAYHGHLDVVHDLRAHGIHCTSYGTLWVRCQGHLDVVRDLQAHGIGSG